MEHQNHPNGEQPSVNQPPAQPPVCQQPPAQPPVYQQPPAQPPVYQKPPVHPPVYQQPPMQPPVYQQPLIYQQVPVYQQPPASQQPKRPLFAAEKRDMIYALLLAIVSIVCADVFLWSGIGLGGSICTIALFILSMCYSWRYKRRFTGYAAFCAIGYCAGAISFTFSDDAFVKVQVLISMMVLATIVLLEMFDLRYFESGGFRAIGDVFYAAFGLTFGRIGDGFYGLFHRKETDGTMRKRNTGRVLLGIACAIPVMLIVIPLLAASDAAFEGLIEFLTFERIWELIGATLLGLFLCVLLFGQMFRVSRLAPVKPQQKDKRGVESVALCAFEAVIALVYVLYLFSQLAYFFSAFSGLLPKSYTVAQYARRGFFEMTIICGINLLIVFLVLLLAKRKDRVAPKGERILSVFLCLFSLVLIATALSKMMLYIDSFGMTRLRILTSVFMVFLAVLFLAVIAHLLVPKVPYMKIAVVAATLLVLATCYADVDRLIASYNVSAYQTGKLEEIDTDTLEELSSDAAIPYIMKLANDADLSVRYDVQELLHWEMVEHGIEATASGTFEIENYDWRSFNLPEFRARQLLWENREEIWLDWLENEWD